MAEQRGIQWMWVGVSVLTFLIVEAVLGLVFGLLGILTLGIGYILFIVIKPVTYFIGGYITGRVSPGETITEPAIGAVIVSILGTIFSTAVIGPGRFFGMIVAGFIALVFGLIGAYVGEGAQRRGETGAAPY